MLTDALAGAPTQPAFLMQLHGVSSAYGENLALHGINFQIASNQLTGIVGPSGSGKTTLLRTLLGSVKPVAGTVTRSTGLAVSYVPQLETVNWNFPVTVFECVLMSRRQQRLLPRATRSERSDVMAVLERLGISELADRHIRALSGGQQQRMFVARALLRRPTLLLLDEPTSGVDVNTRHDMLHMLNELNAEGLAVVLTTHDLNGMAAHLPHLVCLNRSVIASGSPAQVITPEVLEKTFGARMEVLEHLGIPVVVDEAPARPRAVG